jgi:hypothetical protein
LFCNNRMVAEAAKAGDTPKIKLLLADIENITNPF